MVCFNDKKLYEKAKLLRGWGRSSAVFNESEGIKKRFNIKVDGIPYDGKYIFHDIGYNFLPSEISAAFALEQLKKLPENIKTRVYNFEKLKSLFENSSISKSAHNANFDIMVLKNFGIEVENLNFDTVIAASLCGRKSLGLKNLSSEILLSLIHI